MKNIIIEVPRSGASIQLVLRAGASTGQAVIVASDDVEIRIAEPTPIEAAQTNSTPKSSNGKAPVQKTPIRDLEAILTRLTKLKPTKRPAALNCIKTMFQ